MFSFFIMRMDEKKIGLYLILDRKYLDDFTDLAKYAVRKSIKFVQYRDKKSNREEFRKNAEKIQEITKDTKTNFIVNDRIAVAKSIDADGVHLGQKDTSYFKARKIFPNKIIGISTNNKYQAVAAEKFRADYIGVGPIFPTFTKKNTNPVLGIEKLNEISNMIKIPKIAIGGINSSNITQVLQNGADGCAIISAILTAEHPKKEIDIILKNIDRI